MPSYDVSLLFLPFALGSQHEWLSGFAVFYGLDCVATIPPTVRLVTTRKSVEWRKPEMATVSA